MQKKIYLQSTASWICLELFASDSLVHVEIYLKLSLKAISKELLIELVKFCLFFLFVGVFFSSKRGTKGVRTSSSNDYGRELFCQRWEIFSNMPVLE